jgi:ABC-2 type transport system permease protein
MLLAVQIAYENPKLQSAWFLPLLRAFALTEHMNDFMRGVVDTGRLVTLACVTGAFLFLTVRVVESRRWR